MRRREVTVEEFKSTLEEPMEIIARTLGIEKTNPSILEKLGGEPLVVVACEEDGWLTLRVKILQEGDPEEAEDQRIRG